MPGVRRRPRASIDFASCLKLLFDENLAHILVGLLSDVYPQSSHVRDIGLKSASDRVIWEYAADAAYVIVTKDADFRQRSFLYGCPPKVIWVRVGNCSTKRIFELLRYRRFEVEQFGLAPDQAFLVLS